MMSVKESFFRSQILKVRNIFPEQNEPPSCMMGREGISFDVAALVTYDMIGLLTYCSQKQKTKQLKQ